LIKKKDVAVVHDDHWKLAVVEDLIEGSDGLVHAVHNNNKDSQ